eukprot:CAMPEP_0172595698 /NCGR_PEP_ID=MMETSP1068-20121228/15323_1 /TAXON_ID=35684 /ORGANISM="Pseudopedinella elastica, Strain CCMP716" /LENGTH=66 /DNA_ID=CAMNT_0013394349 /DNA_START=71 /DNA_END=271 /DNA_ORIENTATION=-
MTFVDEGQNLSLVRATALSDGFHLLDHAKILRRQEAFMFLGMANYIYYPHGQLGQNTEEVEAIGIW